MSTSRMKLFSKRPQFSLLTLLMVMTIVALAIVAYRSHFAMTRVAERLHSTEERALLADKWRGEFSTYPPNQFFVGKASLTQQLASNQQQTPKGFWAWHLHIPQGRAARIYLRWNDIGSEKQNLANFYSTTSLTLESGPHAVAFYVFRDSSGKWCCSLQSTRERIERKLTADEAAWLGKPRQIRDTDADLDAEFWNDVQSGPYGGGVGSIEGPGMSPHQLLWFRYPQAGTARVKPDELTTGFSIILREVDAPEKAGIERAAQPNR
jgi:hypothetical protein